MKGDIPSMSILGVRKTEDRNRSGLIVSEVVWTPESRVRTSMRRIEGATVR
jgi:hypothetical protein